MGFKEEVIRVVSKIPKGKVLSYGEVAARAGSPRAARQVGGVLRSSSEAHNLPWWRVVGAGYRITIKNNWEATSDLQKQLLEKEGLKINKNYKLIMK